LNDRIEHRRGLLFAQFDPIIGGVDWANSTFVELEHNCKYPTVEIQEPGLKEDIETLVPELLVKVQEISKSLLDASGEKEEHVGEAEPRGRAQDPLWESYTTAARAQKEPAQWENFKMMVSTSVPPT
jgi:hypothetical protein